MYLWSRGGIVFLERWSSRALPLVPDIFESSGTPGLEFVQKLKESRHDSLHITTMQ